MIIEKQKYYISAENDGSHHLYPEINFREAFQNSKILSLTEDVSQQGEREYQFALSPTIDNIYGFRWPNRVYVVELMSEPTIMSAFESFEWGTVSAPKIKLIDEVAAKDALGANQEELFKALKFLLALDENDKRELLKRSQESLKFLRDKLPFMVQRRLNKEGKRMASIHSMTLKYRESVDLLDPLLFITPYLFQALSLKEFLNKVEGFNQAYYDHACSQYFIFVKEFEEKIKDEEHKKSASIDS